MKIFKHDLKYNGGALVGTLTILVLMILCIIGIIFSVIAKLGTEFWHYGAMFTITLLFPLYHCIRFYRWNLQEMKRKSHIKKLENKYFIMYNKFIKEE